MLGVESIIRLAKKANIPFEDALFIALNTNGIRFDCGYNRMRTALRLTDDALFSYANGRGEKNYYFALPVNPESPFSLEGDKVRLGNIVIGEAVGATEDICDSHYPRRKGTVLNINPNSRTSCRGCGFCYTGYQIPCDLRKLKTDFELRDYFEGWMHNEGCSNLSHLVEVAVVTGCYDSGEDVCCFLRTLKTVLGEYNFEGKIFYLGSQIITKEQLDGLVEVKPLSICLSVETFERRDLLKATKKSLTLLDAVEVLDYARGLGYEATFSYIVGMEALGVMEYHFRHFIRHINKFPIINTLQMHKFHALSLRAPGAHRLEYYLEARKIIERLFAEKSMRPLVWEDYRSLWFLEFNGEQLSGIREP
jgi:hypothetical protein